MMSGRRGGVKAAAAQARMPASVKLRTEQEFLKGTQFLPGLDVAYCPVQCGILTPTLVSLAASPLS